MATYILGENYKLNTYSAISCLGNTHYIWYSKDLHKANFLLVLN